MTDKYQPATFPPTKEEALRLAEEREAWAKAARAIDRPGSAKEFELSALLLRFYANSMPLP